MAEKMKITLVNKAEFMFDESAYKTVDKSVLDMLVGAMSTNPESEDTSEKLPEVYVFKSKDDYAKTAYKFDIDESKPAYVNDKGQIFCFRG